MMIARNDDWSIEEEYDYGNYLENPENFDSILIYKNESIVESSEKKSNN